MQLSVIKKFNLLRSKAFAYSQELQAIASRMDETFWAERAVETAEKLSGLVFKYESSAITPENAETYVAELRDQISLELAALLTKKVDVGVINTAAVEFEIATILGGINTLREDQEKLLKVCDQSLESRPVSFWVDNKFDFSMNLTPDKLKHLQRMFQDNIDQLELLKRGAGTEALRVIDDYQQNLGRLKEKCKTLETPLANVRQEIVPRELADKLHAMHSDLVGTRLDRLPKIVSGIIDEVEELTEVLSQSNPWLDRLNQWVNKVRNSTEVLLDDPASISFPNEEGKGHKGSPLERLYKYINFELRALLMETIDKDPQSAQSVRDNPVFKSRVSNLIQDKKDLQKKQGQLAKAIHGDEENFLPVLSYWVDARNLGAAPTSASLDKEKKQLAEASYELFEMVQAKRIPETLYTDYDAAIMVVSTAIDDVRQFTDRLATLPPPKALRVTVDRALASLEALSREGRSL